MAGGAVAGGLVAGGVLPGVVVAVPPGVVVPVVERLGREERGWEEPPTS